MTALPLCRITAKTGCSAPHARLMASAIQIGKQAGPPSPGIVDGKHQLERARDDAEGSAPGSSILPSSLCMARDGEHFLPD